MKRLNQYSRSSVYRIRRLLAESDHNNSQRARRTSSSESDEEVIRPKRTLTERNIDAPLHEEPQVHNLINNDHHAIGEPAIEIDMNETSQREDHDEHMNQDLHLSNNEEAVSDHHLSDNEAGSDHHHSDNGAGSDHHHSDNGAGSDHHHSDNGAGSDHHHSDNEAGSEHHYSDNGAGSDHHHSDNEAGSEHHYSDNEAGSDHYHSDGQNEDAGEPEEDYGWDLDDDLLVYELAPISLGESMAAILSFHLKYNLPQTALSDLIELIGLHCRKERNHFPKSLYHFKKFFANLEFKNVRHYYCSVCFKQLPSSYSICEPHNKGNNYFIQIPLIPQLKALYRRPGFKEKLNYKVNRRKFNENNYEDIYDGDVYKALSEPGQILSDPANISLTWYTDGVSIFKSAKSELWPFYLTINELPYNERSKVSNALLAGVWFGKNKPSPATFLEPIQRDVVRLSQNVDVSWGNNPVQHMSVKAIVMCGTADLPAKALFLNFKNHNARHGCAVCLIETRNVRRGLNVYPYGDNLVLRTQQGTAELAREAQGLPGGGGAPADVLGVKGPSILSRFVYKYVETAAIDVMHSAFLGITKALLTMWFDSKFSDQQFSLRRYTALVNRRLSEISPPTFVQRLSRTLDDIKYWKAHELKTFLLYYSFPVLNDLLPELYADHHKLLVLGVYLFNQRSVSERDLHISGEVLKEYVGLFEDLYGLENITCNLHQLLHLPDVVRKFGPLWVTSCFPYEDLNGKLKKLVKGTRHAELQVCSGVSMLMKFAELVNHIPQNGRAGMYIQALGDPRRKLSTVNIMPRFDIVGKVTKKHTFCNAILEALYASGAEGRNFFEFHRLMKYSILLRSEIYEQRGMMTKTSCVRYKDGPHKHFGFINRFVRVSDCHCQNFCGCASSYFAIIRRCLTNFNFEVLDVFDDDEPLKFLGVLRQVVQGYVAVNVKNISSVCFVVAVADKGVEYLIEPVNMIECE